MVAAATTAAVVMAAAKQAAAAAMVAVVTAAVAMVAAVVVLRLLQLPLKPLSQKLLPSHLHLPIQLPGSLSLARWSVQASFAKRN